MSEVKLNPRVKQQIQNVLIEGIYLELDNKLNKTIYNLVEENTVKTKRVFRMFVYKGQDYSNEHTSYRYMNKPRLDQEFHIRMDNYLAELHELHYNERPYVLNYISKVLNASNSITDYLKLLPPHIHPLLYQFNTQEHIDAGYHLPSTMSDTEVECFLATNEKLLVILKSRAIIDLIM